MKGFHVFNFILIALVLVAICVVEEVLVSQSLADIQNRCLEIENMVEEEGNIQNTRIVLALDNLQYRWGEEESKLCYLVHHKSVQEIGQEIIKARQYIAQDEVQEFEVSIALIKFYCHSYLHFMGASVHNIL